MTDFIFSDSKITVDDDCSHKIKTRLFLERRAMTVYQKTKTSLCQQTCIVKAMIFPVVMYGCESWNIEKAEYQRIDAFELWCWRRLLRVPWIARRSNQFILKETSSIFIGRTDV